MKYSIIKQQKGLSLIELMIAVALGVFISAGMISIFINSSQSYRVNENMSRLQENSRFAMLFITRDIRSADYRSCVTDDRMDDAIAGEDNHTNTGTGDFILDNTDSLTILRQTDNCDDAATRTVRYTIEDRDETGNPSLVSIVDDDIEGDFDEELVGGISGMQIFYGEDTNNDNIANYYVDASKVVDMAQVISVRVTLTAQTLDDNLTSDGDRITRDFTSTIALRNRLP